MIDFFDNSQWPGSPLDLNVCENLGAILKDRVENKLSTYPITEQLSESLLIQVVENELREISNDTDLFFRLLASYPARLEAVKKANGGPTDY